MAGCREECCVRANSRACKRYKLRRLQVGDYLTKDAGPAREHLLMLLQYMSKSAVGEITGMGSRTGVTRILNGEQRRVGAALEARILAATPADLVGNRYVNATFTRRRLQSLVALGYSPQGLAARLDYTRANMRHLLVGDRAWVTSTFDQRVRALWGDLHMTLPQPHDRFEAAAITKARKRAEANGWLPPLAWDDIDDPAERPATGRARPRRDDIDEAVVLRVLAGERMAMTRAERVEVVRRARERGWSEERIQERTGIAKATDAKRFGEAS